MYRVFDPTPILPPGASLEFEEDKYFVVVKGKRIKTGDVVEVEEDLIKLQHNPEKMMLALARIRGLIHASGLKTGLVERILEATQCR